MSLGKNNNMNLSDFSDIFGGVNSQGYKIENISESALNIYKKAYIKFKEQFKESVSNITLDIENNTLNLNKFSGIDMFYFGVMYGKEKLKDESTNN